MTAPKLVRFAAVLVVLAGYVAVVRGGEARIAQRTAENARIAERLAAGERTLAARGVVERDRARLRKALRLGDPATDRGTSLARFLRDAARLAAAHRCTIVGITAGTQPVPAVSGPAAPADRFAPVTLELTVEGRYAELLATIRALSAAPVPARVEVASLTRKNANASNPTVSASLRVALQRPRSVTAEGGGAGARHS